jgi:hypothetical protein
LFALGDSGFGLYRTQTVGQQSSEIIVFHTHYLFYGYGLAVRNGDFRAGFEEFLVPGPAFKGAVNQHGHNGSIASPA